MANPLKIAVVHSILTLKQLGWSHRQIAKKLRIDRETVARYVHSPPEDSKPARNRIPGPESLCEPFRAVIAEKLGQGLTGQRIHQDLVEAHGFAASYSSVRRFLQRLDQGRPLPFRWLEVLPGEEARRADTDSISTHTELKHILPALSCTRETQASHQGHLGALRMPIPSLLPIGRRAGKHYALEFSRGIVVYS